MSKPARGTKRVCPSCGARFYDLNRSPITCPVCQAIYQVTPPVSRRGERAQPVEAKKEEEQEADAPVLESAEVISLEEVEEAGDEAAIEEDEEIVDLGDDAPEIPAGDDDNAFLEEEEEGEADVSGIVGGGKAEES
ncbi:MAG TPA: TIGR02300 family protein [Methyloceanibacter sp.]|nr:TIGR02300 family protein [Methyloceanibacter sp.]